MKVESIVVLKVRFPYGVFSKSLCRMRLTVFENIGFDHLQGLVGALLNPLTSFGAKAKLKGPKSSS